MMEDFGKVGSSRATEFGKEESEKFRHREREEWSWVGEERALEME